MSTEGQKAKSTPGIGARRFGPKALLLLGALLLAAAALAPTGASAAPPEAFWTRCAANTEADIQCNGPRGIATSPVDGHVFVAESINRRIAEFTAWGGFIRAWGWDVVQSGPGETGSGFEICVPADGDVCKAGTGGTGAGQFGVSGSPQGVAVDSAGDVYVLDRGIPSNNRVQKFDPEGHFLRMWGKGVNTGTGVNKEICTNAGAPTDACGAGGEGTGPGQFGNISVLGNYIAVDTLGTPSAADDKVYVGDQGRIQRFNSDGEYQSEIAVPGLTVKGLAVDPAGNLYASFCGPVGCSSISAKADVRKWSPGGVEQTPVVVADPEALASGPAGELFVVDGTVNPTIRQFSPAGVEVPGFAFKDVSNESTGIATGSACFSSGYELYVSYFAEAPNASLRAYGPPPDESALCPPPLHAPEILEQAALSVQTESANVQASINPKFWADTSYYVQYATASCIEALGWSAPCVSQKPSPPGDQLGVVGDEVVKTQAISLTGLAPATEYRYRFVSQSGGGGPVFGKGGTEAQVGEDAVFTTPTTAPPPPETNCENQAFRVGPSAFLPDCRAYEMVSPVDKNGGDIRSNLGGGEYYVQASPDAERLTYTAAPAFGDQPSSKIYNQYLATRQAGGWSNHGINAPLGRHLSEPLAGREGGPFSADLCSEWVSDSNTFPLTPDAQEGFLNIYRQDTCGASGFEALTTSAPAPGASPLNYVSVDSVQGFSADLGEVFFTAEAGLTPDAASTNSGQLYVHTDAGLVLVSVLPGGVADPGSNSGDVVGSGSSGFFRSHLEHAVSNDGSRVFWSSGFLPSHNTGKIYLREHPEQGIVAEECSDEALACTVEVSSGLNATFWSADPSASKALYSEGELDDGEATLYGFDVKDETRTVLAAGLMGVLGASTDLSRIYYVSSEALTGAQENSEGEVAQAGQPNLYLDEGGQRTFIATLLGGEGGDLAGRRVDLVPYHLGAPNPLNEAARVSADGTHIVFESRAQLTGFNNTASNSGKAATEVFTYEAGGGLKCISCNPTGALPAAKQLPLPFINPDEVTRPKTGVWSAAWIPTVEHPLYTSNVLSANGGRIFFNSFDPLLRSDTNGVQDVYEWEAPGVGSCTSESPSFHQANGGCLYLISSGESSSESTFIAAGPDGRDVFFTTQAGLLPQDPGSFDIYDARAGGGLPQPTPPPECEGEACQSPPPPPIDPTLSSASFKGAGNPKKSAKLRCAKSKRAVRRGGKTRCVSKQKHSHKRHHKRANDNRGAKR